MSPTLVFKIARREYLARVRSRAFVVMTVFVPAFLGHVPAGGADAGAIEQERSPDRRPGRRDRPRRRSGGASPSDRASAHYRHRDVDDRSRRRAGAGTVQRSDSAVARSTDTCCSSALIRRPPASATLHAKGAIRCSCASCAWRCRRRRSAACSPAPASTAPTSGGRSSSIWPWCRCRTAANEKAASASRWPPRCRWRCSCTWRC